MSTPPTPEIKAEIRRLLSAWQDSDVFIRLHALTQANLLSVTLKLGNGNTVAPDPTALRIDAADIRLVADGMAQFLEGLAGRIEAGSN